MGKKRVTIYDIAAELGFTASYVSRALNGYPSVSPAIVALVKKKATELNYKHNSSAANLRQGHSKTIGVIVPHINQSFFSDAIAGIEEICFEHGHSLVICQSHESQKQENLAIETLIRQNVDCIFISVSIETQSTTNLEEITNNDIGLIQFDRYLDPLKSNIVINDNRQASFDAVKRMLNDGYKRIAFLGGPHHMKIFNDRKEGYIEAIKQAGLTLPDNFTVTNVLGKEAAMQMSRELLTAAEPPDAFFTVSDHQSLGVLLAAKSLSVNVPENLGIIGFANESFTELISPALSSIDQHGKELGRTTASLYFTKMINNTNASLLPEPVIVKSDLIVRESSAKINSL
ncbi:LacI family DNA-binding transcriptional regulator [Mucilaginibacter sp.]|uniref:LacI family DNA-binding transcriptional regulator n=1 Tax=Mucilaginibacter sp. TaxID=1882438 RepID=UPI0032656328